MDLNIMKYILLILAGFIFIDPVYSQTTISGVVRDDDSGEALPYVMIGLKNFPRGTVSGREGRFTIAIPPEAMGDTILFSHMGYGTASLPVSDPAGTDREVRLKQESIVIEDVVVVKSGKIGNKKAGHSNAGTRMFSVPLFDYTDLNSPETKGQETGVVIKIKKDCKVNSARFYISINKYESITFRFNLYAIENGLPAGNLLTDNVIFEVRDHARGWYEIDLSPYDPIFIGKGNDVVASIQLVDEMVYEGAKQFHLNASLLPATGVFHRNNISDKWELNNITLAFYLDTITYE